MEQYNALCETLTRLGEASVPTQVTQLVALVNSAIPVSEDQIRFLFLVFLAYPFGYLYRFIPSATLKHLYSIIVSIWFCNFIVSYQWIHTLILPVLCYLLLVIVGPKHGRLTIFVTAMGYLSCLHIYRMMNDYMGWKFDVTTQVMIIVQRVTAFAFNYYDGTVNPEPREAPAKGFFEKTYSVSKLPGLLPFLGWIYMPAVFPMGPFVEYKHFERLANGELKVPSSCVVPALKAMGTSIICLALFQVGNGVLGYSIVKFREAEFLESHGPVELLLILLLSCFFVRQQYYFGFKISEGAAIISGLGYAGQDPKTKEHKWDACLGVDIKSFELASSYSMASNAWNIQTSVWLKRYIFFRLPRGINLYATYAVSAFWHGFYPGYYIFFLTIAVVTSVHGMIREKVAPHFNNDKWRGFYDVASVVTTVVSANYFVLSFALLDARMTIRAFSAMGFSIHILTIVVYIVLSSGLIKAPKKKD